MPRSFFALLMLATVAAGSAGPRAIDTARSSARFSVQHIWVEHVTGTVPIVSGSLVLSSGSAIPVEATAVLDATRIATGEPDRDRQLESPDFFDVKQFPRWMFESTKIVPKSLNAFEMDGTLTIHGVAHPERLNVTVTGTPGDPRYDATAQIDRRVFGMALTRLDPTIGRTVDITLDVVLK